MLFMQGLANRKPRRMCCRPGARLLNKHWLELWPYPEDGVERVAGEQALHTQLVDEQQEARREQRVRGRQKHARRQARLQAARTCVLVV
jgi:hypothetical protein